MARDGLTVLAQDDFSAGAYPLQPAERVPPNGMGDALEVLIGDDGLPYRRGGSTYKSNTDTLGGGFFWNGWLGVGERTLWTSLIGQLYALATDRATPVLLDNTIPLGGGGRGNFSRGKAAIINGMVVLPGGAIWGGSLKTGPYNTGSLNLTQGSDQVVGIGTAFLANVDAGMLLNHGRFYVVKSVQDNTHLTLAEPYQGVTVVNDPYVMQVLGGAGKVAQVYVAVANKLVALIDDTMHESAVDDPQTFPDGEKIQLPAGVRLLGGEAIRDQLVLFTTGGVFVVSNIALDLTDSAGNPQQRIERVNSDLILASWEGVTNWRNALIVPAIDGVWIFDGVSAPQRISEGIQARYDTLFAHAYSGGGYATVHSNHYLLPVPFEGVLACRLLPTRRGRGTTAFAWTTFEDDGYGGHMNAFAVSVHPASDAPELLGLNAGAGRVVTLNYFSGSGADANGDVQVAEIVTPEYRLTSSVKTLIARLRARYELGPGGAALELAYSLDGAAWVNVSPDAPEATLADDPFVWKIAKRCKGIRFRIRTSDEASQFLLHSLEIFLREPGKP